MTIHEKELTSSVRALATGGRRRNKYNAKSKFSEDGHHFDSKREHSRYQALLLMERAGLIRNLVTHPIYPIRWPTTGELICVVELDFEYSDIDGTAHYEDVKGVDTALSRLKRKLVETDYHFKVEVLK